VRSRIPKDDKACVKAALPTKINDTILELGTGGGTTVLKTRGGKKSRPVRIFALDGLWRPFSRARDLSGPARVLHSLSAPLLRATGPSRLPRALKARSRWGLLPSSMAHWTCQARATTQVVLRRESWAAQWGRGLSTAPLLPGGRQRLVLPCLSSQRNVFTRSESQTDLRDADAQMSKLATSIAQATVASIALAASTPGASVPVSARLRSDGQMVEDDE